MVFTYRPLVDNIRLSFRDWNISSPQATFIGLANYIEWFQADSTVRIVLNTVIFTFATVVGSLALGLMMAMILDQKLFGRNLVRSVVFAPYIISGAAIGVAFSIRFRPQRRPHPRYYDSPRLHRYPRLLPKPQLGVIHGDRDLHLEESGLHLRNLSSCSPS